MKYLGIDYGSKRIGLAVGNDVDYIAFPREVVGNTNGFLSVIEKYIQEGQVEAVVIGDSRDNQGNPNPIMREVSELVKDIKTHLNIPVYLQPEMYTSHQAVQIQGKNDMIDASAASIILTSFLEGIKNDRGESDDHADIFDSIHN